MVDSRASEEGFRNPPKDITGACLAYMHRVIEIRSFIGFFFSIVKGTEPLLSALTSEQINQLKSQLGDGAKAITYNYSVHRQLVNEMLLSRAVECFNGYLVNILREIFEHKPDILRSVKSVDINMLFELRDFDAILEKIIEKKLHDLAYKSLNDLDEFMKVHTGISLFQSNQARHSAILATEVRNLVAHNDCTMNEIFRQRTLDVPQDFELSPRGKIRIDDDWIRQTCYSLDGIVFDFDQLAMAKFNIKNARDRAVSTVRDFGYNLDE